MKINILYLEDEAGIRVFVSDFLLTQGYDVHSFRRIDQAKEFFCEKKEKIDCVIVDLNMDDVWLEEYQGESDGGLLSGWVWLQRFVFPYTPNMPTIIFSGYNQYLKEFLKDKNQLYLLEKDNIKCVEKAGGDEDGFLGLFAALEELFPK